MDGIEVKYNKENDILLIHRMGVKSQGAIEIADFIIDFTNKMNRAIALEVLNASETLKVPKTFLSHIKKANLITVNKGDAIYVYYLLVGLLKNKEEKIEKMVTIPLKAS